MKYVAILAVLMLAGCASVPMSKADETALIARQRCAMGATRDAGIGMQSQALIDRCVSQAR